MSTTSSTVCQNLQPCSDPFPFEPRDSTNQSTPPKRALSFLWAPSPSLSPSPSPSPSPEQVYVHPTAKRSSSSWKTISLEMCTESLCSETGNGIVSNPDDFPHNLPEKEKQSMIRNKPARDREFTRRITKFSDFPPPLTSISGDGGIRVQTRREGGRLVIRAFDYTSSRDYFRTVRENGRLKLSLIRDVLRDNEKEEEEIEGENVDEAERDCCENGSDDEGDFNGRRWGRNDLRDDGCKMNGGDWSGGGRCNEERSRGSKRLPSLPYCVAIS